MSVVEPTKNSDDGYDGLGEYDPSERLRPSREVVVGDPQLRVIEKDRSVTSILRELAAIQQQGPQKYCILGTRHCSYLHQQIIELLYVQIFLTFCRRDHLITNDGIHFGGNSFQIPSLSHCFLLLLLLHRYSGF